MTVMQRAIAIPTEFEFRDVNGKRSFEGYAAVFNAPSEPLPFREILAPGSFTRTLKSDRDHTFVIDHDDSKLLGSRRAGTAQFSEDSKGLLVRSADLPKTSYANDLIELHDRGEIRSMSFEFSTPRRTASGGPAEEWSDDNMTRTLHEVRLYHATVLTGHRPAYPQTTAFIRSLAQRMKADPDALAEAIDALRDGNPLSDDSATLIAQAVDSLREHPAPADPPAESNLARYQELLAAKDHSAFIASLNLAPRQ